MPIISYTVVPYAITIDASVTSTTNLLHSSISYSWNAVYFPIICSRHSNSFYYFQRTLGRPLRDHRVVEGEISFPRNKHKLTLVQALPGQFSFRNGKYVADESCFVCFFSRVRYERTSAILWIKMNRTRGITFFFRFFFFLARSIVFENGHCKNSSVTRVTRYISRLSIARAPAGL